MSVVGKTLSAIINSTVGGEETVINNAYKLFNTKEEDEQYIRDIITATNAWDKLDKAQQTETKRKSYDKRFQEKYSKIYSNLNNTRREDLKNIKIPRICYVGNFLGAAYFEDMIIDHISKYNEIYREHCYQWDIKRCGLGKNRKFDFSEYEIEKDYGDISVGPYNFDIEVDAKGYHQRQYTYNLRHGQKESSKEDSKYQRLVKHNDFSICICFMHNKIKFFIVDFMYGIPHSTAYLISWFKYTDTIYLPLNKDDELFLDFNAENLCKVLHSICEDRHPGTINNNPTLYCRIPKIEDVNMNVWSKQDVSQCPVNYYELKTYNYTYKDGSTFQEIHGEKLLKLWIPSEGINIPEHYLNDDGSLKRTQPFDTQGIPREQILYNQLQNIQAI